MLSLFRFFYYRVSQLKKTEPSDNNVKFISVKSKTYTRVRLKVTLVIMLRPRNLKKEERKDYFLIKNYDFLCENFLFQGCLRTSFII